jgi:putative batD protein
MKRLLLFIFISLIEQLVLAQAIQVSAPRQVKAGENFRVAFTISTQDVNGFKIGTIPNGLELITGPYTSMQSSVQNINGKVSSSSSVTYTYTLYAAKNGSYTISPSTATLSGKTIHSKPIAIVVSGTSTRNSGAPNMHNDYDEEATPRRTAGKVTDKDLFIRVSADKNTVYEQQPILLTYKVYTLLDLTQLEGKMPELTGFHTQEIPLPQQKSFHVERVNGKNYRCVTWSQYVMFPQVTGKLEIPSITYNGTLVQRIDNLDPMEAFLNGGANYTEIKKEIKAPSLSITVLPLPNKPANFSGGVGSFTISSSLDKKVVKSGDAVVLRVVVNGVGNLKLLKQPVFDLPKDFDKYDPKIIDKTKVTSRGVEGQMIYEYILVPRNQGNYTIGAIPFVYYDTAAKNYKTIQTTPLNIKVEKGAESKSRMESFDGENLTDIQGIRKGHINDFQSEQPFWASPLFYTLHGLVLLIFVLTFLFLRKQQINSLDVLGQKHKRASKEAAKRLKKARTLLQKEDSNAFYDEVLKALWEYVGNKLNMPIEMLTRDNIIEKLSSLGVNENAISLFIKALDECEYARFAPGDKKGNMTKTYEYASDAIVNIDDAISNKKSSLTALKAILLFFGLQLLALSFLDMKVQATNISESRIESIKDSADTNYQKGIYTQAIKEYQELLKVGESATLYYNLANAYYKTNNLALAVLNYERALRLSPNDKGIRANLQFVNSKLVDNFVPESQAPLVSFYYSVINAVTTTGWAILSLVALCLFVGTFLIYRYVSSLKFQKISFTIAMFSVVLFILSNLFAYQQQRKLSEHNEAIVMSSKAEVFKTPNNSAKTEITLHEGTKVKIVDSDIKNWFEVSLPDGRSGWVKASLLERI